MAIGFYEDWGGYGLDPSLEERGLGDSFFLSFFWLPGPLALQN